MGASKNGYQNNEVSNQHPQVMEGKPLQFNAMSFESCDKFAREESDENDQEELLFPFNEEKELEHSRIHGYGSDNLDAHNLKRKEEPLSEHSNTQ